MSYQNTLANRVTIRIPLSILELIDRILRTRIEDGEANATRSSVALELLKLGARIEKKKLDNIENGSNPFDNRLEEQLSFIANSVIRTSVQVERFFSIFSEINQVSPNLFQRITNEVRLNDEEKKLLKRLFVDLGE